MSQINEEQPRWNVRKQNEWIQDTSRGRCIFLLDIQRQIIKIQGKTNGSSLSAGYRSGLAAASFYGLVTLMYTMLPAELLTSAINSFAI